MHTLSSVLRKSGLATTYPHDELHVSLVPRVALVVSEEAPRVFDIFIGKQDAYALALGQVTAADIVPPNDRQEQWSSSAHDGDVRQTPATIVAR